MNMYNVEYGKKLFKKYGQHIDIDPYTLEPSELGREQISNYYKARPEYKKLTEALDYELKSLINIVGSSRSLCLLIGKREFEVISMGLGMTESSSVDMLSYKGVKIKVLSEESTFVGICIDIKKEHNLEDLSFISLYEEEKIHNENRD